MTEAQIEAIARLYCRKLGLDPDAGVFFVENAWMPDGVPAWRLKATEAREALAMSEAIAEVRATVEVK